MMNVREQFDVVDLFSGAGGMSYGFQSHPNFRVIAAADAELGKPSSGSGSLQCNGTYALNIGVEPTRVDLGSVSPEIIRERIGLAPKRDISVVCACPPCTGFSRAVPNNHLRDDHRNELVRASAEFAASLDADIVVMENARELITGNFRSHYDQFRDFLEISGYRVQGATYKLTRFGLPQIRERAFVVAAKRHLPLYTLEDLWAGWRVDRSALTVRRTIAEIGRETNEPQSFPGFSSESVRARIAAIPHDGGSWVDLLGREDEDQLLTESMKKIVKEKRFGSYPDVYGRMAWDRPAPTIKRECAHVGNGRYAHPEEDRLCSVREMAALQGFPRSFQFNGAAISNLYRHIGDAVPPLISYQLAHICNWMLTGSKPKIEEVVLQDTNLQPDDVLPGASLNA